MRNGTYYYQLILSRVDDRGGRCLSEKRNFVALVETGVIAAVPHHELVAHLVVNATVVLFDEEMVIGAVRRRAVHRVRVQIYRADGRRRPDLELVAPFFDHSALNKQYNITDIKYRTYDGKPKG